MRFIIRSSLCRRNAAAALIPAVFAVGTPRQIRLNEQKARNLSERLTKRAKILVHVKRRFFL